MTSNLLASALSTFLLTGIGWMLLWAALIALLFYLASRFIPWQEKWRQYEGSIITAIRLAEKQIKSDTPNSAMAKLDKALQFVIDAYAEANEGALPSDALVENLRQGIQIKHNEMVSMGMLPRVITRSDQAIA